MGKSSTPSTQTVVQQSSLPPWVSQGGQDLFAQSQAAAQNMPGPYMGNLVPGQSNDTNAAYNMTRGAAGLALPGLQAASSAANNTANYNPQQVQGANSLSGNLQAYLNPGIQNVINPTMALMEQQRQGALNGIGDQANAAHAYGGSRQGVAEGVTNAQYGMNEAKMAGDLNNQNFTQAYSNMNNDLQRQQQASLANQTAGLQGAQINNQGALGLGNISTAMQQQALGGAAALQASGQGQQAYQGSLLAQNANQYNALRNAPFDPISKQLQALSGTPYATGSSTTSPYQGPSGLMQGLGAASSGIGLANGLSNLGAFSGISGLLGSAGAAGGIGMGTNAFADALAMLPAGI